MTTYHNDQARDGVNGNETVLTPGIVSGSTFTLLKNFDNLDGLVYAQPLYLSGVTMNRTTSCPGSNKNIAIVATENFSRIVLAPDSQSDGFLDVRHIYGLNLRKKTDLVVLSACRTVLGRQSSGDDIVGLNRAFIYAGSPSVIASLWSVREKQTGDLMESFFGHLHGGMCKADALCAAQSETRAKYPNPYFWASFVLTGDPGDCHGSVTKIINQQQ